MPRAVALEATPQSAFTKLLVRQQPTHLSDVRVNHITEDTNARPVAISTLKALHARIWFAVHGLREGVILREGCRYAGVNGIHSPDAMTLSRTRLNIKERNNAVPGCLQPSTMSREQSSPEAADNQSSAH